MNTTFIEETGARAVELAASLGRIHADNLTTLADATAKTPLGPLFSMNAKLAVMTTEGLESVFAPLATKKPTPKKAKKPAAAKAQAAAKPVKATPAPQPAKPVAVEAIEPEAEDVIAETASETVSIHDDLSVINGVGPSTMRKLKDAGIRRYADIADMPVAKLESLLESHDVRMIRYSAADWIAQAKELCKVAA